MDTNAAAERLRANEYVYKDSVTVFRFSRERTNDVCDLANAYLAEHPADDGEAITEDWLKSIGFKAVPSDMGPAYSDHYERDCLNLWNFNGMYWLINGYDGFDLKTRSQIRNLAKALSIPLTETK